LGRFQPTPRPLPPLALATPSPSAHLRPTPRSRPRTTDTPSTLVSRLPLALARDRSRWQAGPTSQPPHCPRRVWLRRGHLRPPSSSSPRPLAHPLVAQGSSAPPRPRRCGRVLARHRPAVRSRRRRCAALTPALCNLTGVRLAPSIPFPREPIKGSPRAPLSPAPASATHLAPHPSTRASAAVFFPSGKPFPLSSLPFWWFSEQLARLISCATLPRAWNTTPLPQSPHEPHRRRLPPWSSATSPWSAPSQPPLAKLGPPLSSPAPLHARAPARCPRTGSPPANRRRAHRRPVFFPADDRFAPPRRPLAPSPPPTLSGAWASRKQHHPSRARGVFRLGP
jgi:hypothetical protein